MRGSRERGVPPEVSRLGALTGVALGAALVVGAPAHAQVSWTDWTSAGPSTASGTLTFGTTPVGITYSGPYAFVQTACGTNYWVPNVYTSATVPNAPTPCDIVALDVGGSKSITFSQAVTNPFIAFLSWNGQGATPVPFTGFNGATAVTPFLQLLSQGTSYWGSGTASVSGNNLIVSGEVGGTVELVGTFTQIDFSDLSENWHGSDGRRHRPFGHGDAGTGHVRVAGNGLPRRGGRRATSAEGKRRLTRYSKRLAASKGTPIRVPLWCPDVWRYRARS